MPKTFKQNLLFTAMMSFLMVYVMILFAKFMKNVATRSLNLT